MEETQQTLAKVWVTERAMAKTFPVRTFRYAKPSLGDSVLITKAGPAFYIDLPHWHATPESAIARIEQMKTERLASLRAEIARVEAIDPVELVRSAK